MRETAAEMAEAQKKRDIEERDRLKREHDAHAAQLKEQLRLDYIERFGKEPPPEETFEDKVQEKSAKQQCAYWVNTMKKNYLTLAVQ